MDFKKLVDRIQQTNFSLQRNAVKAVNTHLTIRNWLTGFYILKFEQNGSDRAKYGTKLLENIAHNINIKGLTHPELSRCRQFFSAYPQILGLLTQESANLIPNELLQDNNEFSILVSSTQEFEIEELKHILKVIQSISYTHFTELLKIDDSVKRRFYEMLILKTQPSVKELRRHIETLTFERIGLSKNQEISFHDLVAKIHPEKAVDLVKSHYFFEFLEIPQTHIIEENDLEQALISHLL